MVAVLGVCYTIQSCRKDEESLISKDVFIQDSEEFASDESGISELVCYITGAVVAPGVYSLEKNARICDLLESAGGFTEDADVISVNLAEILYDGAHIHVYAIGESQSAVNSDGRVNINSCSKEELLTLPGIGEKKAEAILAYRVQNGSFSSVEDIMNVSGIGQAMFEEIKDYIKVQGQ